jgi:hypothetical protein
MVFEKKTSNENKNYVRNKNILYSCKKKIQVRPSNEEREREKSAYPKLR